MSAILEAWKRANLTVAEVARAVGRRPDWLNLAEQGVAALRPEDEKVILEAIPRLARFAESVRAAKEKLTADLHLPPRGSHAV